MSQYIRTVSQDSEFVLIDNIKIEGELLDEKCECGSRKVWFEKYDAKFCPQEDKWLEAGCDDPKCEYCRNRPQMPFEQR